jgi:hypothetical protein
LRVSTMFSLGRSFNGSMRAPQLVTATPIQDCGEEMYRCDSFYLLQSFDANLLEHLPNVDSEEHWADHIILYQVPFFQINTFVPFRTTFPSGWAECAQFKIDGPWSDPIAFWKICARTVEEAEGNSIAIGKFLMFQS